EDAKNKLSDAEVRLRKIQESTGLIEIDAQAKSIIQAATLAREKVAAKQVELNSMRSYATSSNPDLLRIQRELDTLKAQADKLEKRQRLQDEGDIAIPTSNVPSAGLEFVRGYREVK